MTITTDQYRRARHIAEDAAELLRAAIRPDARGGPGLHPRILLTGMLLTLDDKSGATVSSIHETLTVKLPRNLQWDLGVLTGTPEKHRKITVNQLYKLTQRISAQLDYTERRAPDADEATRAARRGAVAVAVATALLAPTLIPRPEGHRDYALDGTGIWAAERAPETLPENVEKAVEVNTAYGLGAAPGKGKGDKGASDAAYGGKTSKTGELEMFFGYDCEALVTVPNPRGRDAARTEPHLVTELVVLPASTHITEPCLGIIDRVLATGAPVGRLIVDRHYSYKKFDQWLSQLLARGITQVADAHANDQGFRDWDGMRVAAANFHCPSTPDHLGVIPSPAPKADADTVRTTRERIDERRGYAMQYVERLNADGRLRVRCPARNGTLGCPLVAGTVPAATAAGLPVVTPPNEKDRPKVCCQDTVTLRLLTDEQKSTMKLAQTHYWGGPEWRRDYARRTYVESWFGVLKSKTATGLTRGTHQFRGLALVSLVVACAAATTNKRMLREWHDQTGLGDPTHPLLQPDQEFYGFAELDADAAAAVDREYAAAQATKAAEQAA